MGHGNGGADLFVLGFQRLGKTHARQVMDAIDGAQRQRGPAELPGATGLRRLIEHHETLLRRQAQPLQMIGGGQARLAGADDHDIDLEGDARRRLRGRQGRGEFGPLSNHRRRPLFARLWLTTARSSRCDSASGAWRARGDAGDSAQPQRDMRAGIKQDAIETMRLASQCLWRERDKAGDDTALPDFSAPGKAMGGEFDAEAGGDPAAFAWGFAADG